jgi:hypothetical protein
MVHDQQKIKCYYCDRYFQQNADHKRNEKTMKLHYKMKHNINLIHEIEITKTKKRHHDETSLREYFANSINIPDIFHHG